MAHFVTICLIVAYTIAPSLTAQSPDLIQNGEIKLLAIVPLTGTGTYSDPIRPNLPFSDRESASGISFRWVPSDNQRTAIVEFSSRSRSSLRPILEDKRAGVRVFERGRDARAVVETEIKKHRRDFRWADLAIVGRPTAAADGVKP